MKAPPRRNSNVPKSLRFDVLVARYYPAVYSFASRLTDDPREAIALTRDAFNSTRKQLRSCCDDNVFASILTSAVIRAGLTARLKCAHIAGIRGFATAFSCQSRAADGVESSVKLPTAPNTKSPISETWFRRFRRRMMRRNIHGLLGLRDRPPQLQAPVSDAFRALLARTKSKPSIVFCAREALGNHR